MSVPLDQKIALVAGSYRSLIPNQGERIDPISIVQVLYSAGEFELCQGELYQVELLIKNLKDVKLLRPSLFTDLKTKLYQCGTNHNHFGLRMEARIASSLSRKKVTFEYTDAPDFSIAREDGTVFIECTSVWPQTSARHKDYREKVKLAIEKKAAKAYSNTNTAVAMDITSVIAAIITHGVREDSSDFHQYLSHDLSQMNLGAVILFNTVFEVSTNVIHFAYSRVDCLQISCTLRDFLDEFYPKGEIRLYGAFVPGARVVL